MTHLNSLKKFIILSGILSVTIFSQSASAFSVCTDCVPGNLAPSATASSSVAKAKSGSTVLLTGSAVDPEGAALSYAWSQSGVTGKPNLSIVNATTTNASFVAPVVNSEIEVHIKFVASDADSQLSEDQWITITVIPNVAPTVEAGPSQTVLEQANVILAGSATDDDGSIVSYSWLQISGPTVALSNATDSSASFVAPTIGSTSAEFIFQLEATDDSGDSATDSVLVTVMKLDSDGDGTPDEFDAFPFNPVEWEDSDQDGMGDNFEVNNGLNANDSSDAANDVDSDGLTNLQEFSSNTNPNLSDTDGDGVNDGADYYPTDPARWANPAGSQSFGYVHSIGNNSGNSAYADIVHDVHTDGSGNVYQAGAYHYTLDFDSSSGVDEYTSGYYNDAYVIKTNADGSHAWSWNSKGYYGAHASGMAVDDQGNVYISGYFSGKTDFDPDPNVTVNRYSKYSWDGFYAKLDANGQLQWVHTLYGNGREYAQDVAVDSQGNMYVTGYFDAYSMDFDPTNGSDIQGRISYPTLFVTRMNSDGSYGWTHLAGGGATYARKIDVDNLDRVYVSGEFTNTTNFDANDGDGDLDLHTRTSNGNHDGFVMQLDANGGVNWVWTVGGTGNDYVRDIVASEFGLRAVGLTYDVVNFDLDGNGDIQGKSSSLNTFITHLRGDGSYVDTRILPVTYAGTLAIDMDDMNNMYVSGSFSGTVDFDPDVAQDDIRTSAGGTDVYVSKFNDQGQMTWTHTVGGTGGDLGIGMSVTGGGNVYVTGTYKNTVDFDPGEGVTEKTSQGYEDIFLLQLNAN